MQYVDLENWKRKKHFEFFHRMDYPQFNICMDVDVSNFVAFTKENGLSFYYSMVYAVTSVINQVEAFKYRIRGDQVVLHDTVYPSFTDMNKDENDDLFKLVTVDWVGDIYTFEKTAKEASFRQTDYFGLDKLMGRDDLIYITCIPWISFTHISHTISLNRDDSVPRISWGKYYKRGENTLLPFSVQVNHALVDGVHIGLFMDKLQAFLTRIAIEYRLKNNNNDGSDN